MSKLSHADRKHLVYTAGLSEMEFLTVKNSLQVIPEGLLAHEVTPKMTQTKFFVQLYMLVAEGNPDAKALLEEMIPAENLPKVDTTDLTAGGMVKAGPTTVGRLGIASE